VRTIGSTIAEAGQLTLVLPPGAASVPGSLTLTVSCTAGTTPLPA
jgi:hypothetical protein